MSIINHDFKHIFIHVPKTAGTAMEHMWFVGGNSHASASHLVPQAPHYFSWGFVRNPYDRLLSVYTSLMQHSKPGKWLPADMSFQDFVQLLPEKKPAVCHVWPQARFLCWSNGSVAVDFVGRFEQLQSDWLKVCRRLSISGPNRPLQRRNTSNHDEWRSCYTPEMAAIVADLYRVDFETFGYPLETKQCEYRASVPRMPDHQPTSTS